MGQKKRSEMDLFIKRKPGAKRSGKKRVLPRVTTKGFPMGAARLGPTNLLKKRKDRT